jgi:hypothetical protein
VILVLGSMHDSPLSLLRGRLEKLQLPYVHADLQDPQSAMMNMTVCYGEASGELVLGEQVCRLEDFTGVSVRIGATSRSRYDATVSDTAQSRTLRLLLSWCEVTPARVVTRPSVGGSNYSKPYQAQLIRRHGFPVPDTLVTNDPDLALAFYDEHRRVVYKSISSTRSIVRELDQEDLKRMESILWCPTQFQELISGRNVRVHTVNGQCYATAIDTDATDYRYRAGPNDRVQLSGVHLPDDLSARCLGLAEALGVPLAGIDLIVTSSGVAYCLEVNTSPAFSYYEYQTSQPIGYALAEYLAGLAPGELAAA